VKRILAAFIALVIAGALSSASSAAEPITINAVLSLTGAAAFLGTAEDQALHALEVLVNGSGGVKGRPIAFKVADDQSNPQMAVQIVSELKAKNVPLALGPGFSQTCGAARAIVESSGPVLYCL
jgi:branched-chain amino acid transport system substrate-binding protein